MRLLGMPRNIQLDGSCYTLYDSRVRAHIQVTVTESPQKGHLREVATTHLGYKTNPFR